MGSQYKRYGVRHIRRIDARLCFWCGVQLCHSCRPATPAAPGDCEGHRFRLCYRAATRDHLVPKPRRGRGGHPATVVACHVCNQRRGSMPLREWCQALDQEWETGWASTKVYG